MDGPGGVDIASELAPAPRRVVLTDGEPLDLAWSSDGSHLLVEYLGNGSSAVSFVVDRTTGSARRLPPGSWSVYGKTLVDWSGAGWIEYSLAGRFERIVDAPPTSGLLAAGVWNSPAGRTVVTPAGVYVTLLSGRTLRFPAPVRIDPTSDVFVTGATSSSGAAVVVNIEGSVRLLDTSTGRYRRMALPPAPGPGRWRPVVQYFDRSGTLFVVMSGLRGLRDYRLTGGRLVPTGRESVFSSPDGRISIPPDLTIRVDGRVAVASADLAVWSISGLDY